MESLRTRMWSKGREEKDRKTGGRETEEEVHKLITALLSED